MWEIGDQGWVLYTSRKTSKRKKSKPKQFHVRITAWDDKDESMMWVQESRRDDNLEQFHVYACDFTPDNQSLLGGDTMAAATEAHEDDTCESQKRAAAPKRKLKNVNACDLTPDKESLLGGDMMAAATEAHEDDTCESQKRAAAPKRKRKDIKSNALKNSSKDGTARTQAAAKQSRSAGPYPRVEFISCDCQSTPVVVSADEAERVSSTWKREVATYLKFTQAFAKTWLRDPKSFLIAAVMRRRTHSSLQSCEWTEADELQSTPTNIYLQLCADQRGFRVSAVKEYQDRDVRIDHADAYKHRVRCFTCGPSCVQ